MSITVNYALPQASQISTPITATGTQKRPCIFIAGDQQNPGHGYTSADVACQSYARLQGPADIDTLAVLADSGEEAQRLRIGF